MAGRTWPSRRDDPPPPVARHRLTSLPAPVTRARRSGCSGSSLQVLVFCLFRIAPSACRSLARLSPLLISRQPSLRISSDFVPVLAQQQFVSARKGRATLRSFLVLSFSRREAGSSSRMWSVQGSLRDGIQSRPPSSPASSRRSLPHALELREPRNRAADANPDVVGQDAAGDGPGG